MKDYKAYTEEDWRKLLTNEQFYILREAGTERVFTGKYNNHDEPGIYLCAGCKTPLFESETKYASSCGWPSFFDNDNIKFPSKEWMQIDNENDTYFTNWKSCLIKFTDNDISMRVLVCPPEPQVGTGDEMCWRMEN